MFKANEALIVIPSKYTGFADIFSLDLISKDSIAINELYTSENKAIEKVDNDANDIDNVGIVDANRIYTAKFNNLVQAGAGFFTPKARLKFTKSRQVFTIASILHHFNQKYHI